MKIAVTRAGFLTTVQDAGRFGHRQSGVTAGGALDANALRIANLLVGNVENEAGLELTLGKVNLRFSDDRVIAWCGGEFEVLIGKAKLSAGRAALVRDGDELQMVSSPQGARAWLAIGGGIDVPLVLGSRATDLRSKFGGHEGGTLRDGDVLPLAVQSAHAVHIAQRLRACRIATWTAPSEWANTAVFRSVLRVIRGADWTRFSDEATTTLLREAFTVTPDSDRMGVRLDGPELKRNSAEDLLSEAVAPGTIQVPPGGRPILLLGDCQTIGGYPKIAHVITVDMPAAAQLRAGDSVRFAETTLTDAQRLLIERERDVARFAIGLRLRTP